MIVVTGASGQVGGQLVTQLAERHLPVRAVSRHPRTLRVPPGVAAVHGDCDDPATLPAAFDGAERAFLMSAQAVGSAERPTHIDALVHAAARAGVRHVVALSVYTGGGGGDVIGAWHGRAEDAVTGSGMDWTLLRPGRFMSNALRWAPAIRRGDPVAVPFATRPAASIDPADVAAVALAALTTEDHHGAAHQLSGPQSLAPLDELRILEEVLGRAVQAQELPVDSVRAGMLAADTPPTFIEAIVARSLGDVGTEVLPTVARILGRTPTTFAEWARTHAEQFSTATSPRRRS